MAMKNEHITGITIISLKTVFRVYVLYATIVLIVLSGVMGFTLIEPIYLKLIEIKRYKISIIEQ